MANYRVSYITTKGRTGGEDWTNDKAAASCFERMVAREDILTAVLFTPVDGELKASLLHSRAQAPNG